MKLSKLILLIFALIFMTAPNSALADSVSVSAKINVEIDIESPHHHYQRPMTYTGVIVDCRGLALRRAMSPVIKVEDGRIIYGDKDLDFDKIAEIGMASYATNMNDTRRAGSRPLIVRAIGVTDFCSNPVLTYEDAHRVLATDKISGYLKNLNVVFLMD